MSAVAFALRSVTDPTIPANGGALRPVEVIAPAGTVVAARAAGRGRRRQRRGEPAGRRRVPRRARAGRARPGRRRGPGDDEQRAPRRRRRGSTTRPSAAGRAAGPGEPGMSGVHTAMTNTHEHARRGARAGAPDAGAALRGCGAGSGGAGAAPVATASSASSRCWSAHGVAHHRAARPRRGGSPAASRARRARTGCCPAATSTRAERLPDKCTVQLAAGDVLRMLTPGGGGYGERLAMMALHRVACLRLRQWRDEHGVHG